MSRDGFCSLTNGLVHFPLFPIPPLRVMASAACWAASSCWRAPWWPLTLMPAQAAEKTCPSWLIWWPSLRFFFTSKTLPASPPTGADCTDRPRFVVEKDLSNFEANLASLESHLKPCTAVLRWSLFPTWLSLSLSFSLLGVMHQYRLIIAITQSMQRADLFNDGASCTDVRLK